MTNSNDALRAVLEPNVRQWAHYPIEMPVTSDGAGPATIGKDAASMSYEVWDRLCVSHGSFDCLSDAINEAMRLNYLALTPSPVAGGDLREAAAKVAEGNVMSGNDQWAAGHDAAARKIARAIRSLPLS